MLALVAVGLAVGRADQRADGHPAVGAADTTARADPNAGRSAGQADSGDALPDKKSDTRSDKTPDDTTGTKAGQKSADPKVRIPERGPRTYRLAHTSARPLGKRGALITYSVRIEKGLPYDPAATARFVHAVLNDRRSWGRSGQWRLKLVGSGKADIGVYLATPRTTDALCKPLKTEGRVSCFNRHRVVLNADRWAFGARSYRNQLTDYRRNVVNHEFGHALGFGHVACPGNGKRAPIMMQQTKGLHGCRANPWPDPRR
ncbi:DUF3152 domain-containing protein [Microlunatus sp. Gsoil 973]|nr:DUF3152 domain-containing protein [Microlunatus sp. Gsoil 973]